MAFCNIPEEFYNLHHTSEDNINYSKTNKKISLHHPHESDEK
jgi:hypothetical protein